MLPMIGNAVVDGDRTDAGTVVVATCFLGYRCPHGDRIRMYTCTAGQWSPPIEQCQSRLCYQILADKLL